ncbi:hypothetical protein [Mycobacterium sp. 852013-50091_SCH5140682]|uniref:hypothetical protein n=1 Tax=Mycobacterium sp. 852013-50091_SCH5140682 TaxID=1834109 RepID=UPI000AD3015E|nr:hypothetical protein [Mycobacterium sp. 852013-50091_SCH5140682]
MPTHTATSAAASSVEIIDDTASAAETADSSSHTLDDLTGSNSTVKTRMSWRQAIVFIVVPLFVVALSAVTGWLKWVDGSAREAQVAATESVQAARDATIALLSYQPDTVQQTLEAAQTRLTGSFRDSYDQLIHDVVIPGAREKKISAVVNIPAASSISATGRHAEVLVFVNQTSIVGTDAPTDTASSVRVGLDKVDGRWLISSFEPV